MHTFAVRWWKYVILLGAIALSWLLLGTFRPTNAQSATGLIDLSVVSSKPVAQVGDVVDLIVMAHPNGNQLAAAEVRIGYDSEVLSPILPDTVTPGSEFILLPHCGEGSEPPCDATSSATSGVVTHVLGASCSEVGCLLPPTDSSFELTRAHFVVTGAAGTNTEINLNPIAGSTVLAAFESGEDASRVVTGGGVSVSPCALAYDFLPDGIVNIADIMHVASRWNTSVTDDTYLGQLDADADGDLDIADVQAAASAWNSSCT